MTGSILADFGDLMFRCPKTGQDFDSGFRTDQQDLASLPSAAHLRARCPRCGETHELKFAEGWIEARERRFRLARID